MGIESNMKSSPFVDVRNTSDIMKETESWFLVQLPTRLPPLQKKHYNTTNDDNNEVFPEHPVCEVDGGDQNVIAYISEVVTQPVKSQSFDNTLISAAPGKIGKILVYKSGKTVLVMKGKDGDEVSFVLFCFVLFCLSYNHIYNDVFV
jgi:hypothetical protein